MSWLHSSRYYQVQGCSTTHATLFLYWASIPLTIVKTFHLWLFLIHSQGGDVGYYNSRPKVLIGTLSTKIKLWYHFITTLLSTQYCLLQDYNDTHDPPTNSNFVSFIGPISLRKDNNSMLRKRIHFFDNMGHCIK